MRLRNLGCSLILGLFLTPLTADRITLKSIASGLRDPVYVTHSGDSSGRLFIVEQRGRIIILQAGKLWAEPFLDIRSKVDCCGEKGLLGLAFHPNFENNGRFFLNYSRMSGGQLQTVIAEYKVSAENPNVADAAEKLLLEFDQPFSNHNGGDVAFGPDGFLYVATGDGGSGGDPQENGQSKNTLLGKILRIDVDRGDPYAIPADNPFIGQNNVKGEIWAFGLRNPWRISFDRLSGRLFAGDVGQNAWEEVDIIIRGGNYGWNRMEAGHCFRPSANCDTSGLIPPISEYPQTEGNCVIGGYVYRGSQPTSLRGAYIFGDWGSKRIWALEESPSGAWNRSELARPGFSISSFGEDEAGELYVVNHAGEVFQVQFNPSQFFAQAGDGVSGVGILKSTLILINNSSQPVTGEIIFRASDGSPLSVTIDGVTGSRFSFTLPEKSSRAFVTSGKADPLAVGWAEVVSSNRLAGAVLYALAAPSGEPIREAGLGTSDMAREFIAHVNREAAFDLNSGVALANPSSSENAELTFTVKDNSGSVVASSTTTLGPLQHTAKFLHEIGNVPSDFDGTIVITSTGDVVATLIRTKGGVHLSSIPVAN